MSAIAAAAVLLIAIYAFLFGIAGSPNAPEFDDIPNPSGRYRR